MRYRDVLISIAAVVCLVEFMAIGQDVSPENAMLIAILHFCASGYLSFALILYVMQWRWGWILAMRVIFAAFIVLMIYLSFREGQSLLS
ncbi:MAG TPA: hypothetical protein PKJ63_08655 [Cyclobacteriaceae bacterium]|nr:hypothetical protein [Cyclobacteriaceae bacterium]